MSTLYQLPDLPNILRDRLRVNATLVASPLLPTPLTQISTKRLDKVDVDKRNYVHIMWDGGFDRHPSLPLQRPRIALFCYGETDPKAMELANLCAAVLVPYGAQRGWTGEGYAVYDIVQPGTPRPDRHAIFDAPFAKAAFEFRVRLQAID